MCALSPFDARHRALGADFTVFAGIELPNWYEANQPLLEKYKTQIPSAVVGKPCFGHLYKVQSIWRPVIM